MIRSRRLRLALALVLACLFALGNNGLVSPDVAAAPRRAGGIVKVFSALGDSGIGNPIITKYEAWVRWLSFNSLVKYDDYGNQVPDLARSWEFSSDSKTVTFRLVQTTWQDGMPFTSDDVKFTLEKILDEKTTTSLRSRLRVAGQTVTWRTPDAQTVVFELPEPFAPFLYQLSQIAIIPKHRLQNAADINSDAFNLRPVGTGPFVVEQWDQGDRILFRANKNYFLGPPAADGYLLQFFKDNEAANAALLKGELDMKFVSPDQQGQFANNPNFKLLKYVYYTSITLAFNHKHPIVKDLAVREAIALAIDKDTLTNITTKGLGIPGHYIFAEKGPLDGYINYSLPKDEYNPEKAKQKLDEAGWTMGSSGIREKNGERLSLTLVTYTGFDEYKNDCEIIQQMLRPIGIDIQIKLVEQKALDGQKRDPNEDPLSRALEIEEWPHPLEQDPDLYDELHSSALPPGGNYNNYVNAEVDRLLELGRSTVNVDARRQVYFQLQEIMKRDRVSLPLYYAVDAWAVSTRVGGVPDNTPSIRWYMRCCVEKVYLQ